MIEKDPSNYALLTYVYIVLLAIWGGLAKFHRKVKQGLVRWANLTELLGELVVSGFAGLMTFFLCQWADFNMLFTAVAAGIAGHMGTEAIYFIERMIERVVDSRVGRK